MLRLLFHTLLTSVFISTVVADNMSEHLQAVDFEVYGRVQGVFFRKYTKSEADKLNIRGWCKNTVEGSVKGHIEGPSEDIKAMKRWLSEKGSPKSIIERAEFSNSKEIRSYNYQGFRIIEE